MNADTEKGNIDGWMDGWVDGDDTSRRNGTERNGTARVCAYVAFRWSLNDERDGRATTFVVAFVLTFRQTDDGWRANILILHLTDVKRGIDGRSTTKEHADFGR